MTEDFDSGKKRGPRFPRDARSRRGKGIEEEEEEEEKEKDVRVEEVGDRGEGRRWTECR